MTADASGPRFNVCLVRAGFLDERGVRRTPSSDFAGRFGVRVPGGAPPSRTGPKRPSSAFREHPHFGVREGAAPAAAYRLLTVTGPAPAACARSGREEARPDGERDASADGAASDTIRIRNGRLLAQVSRGTDTSSRRSPNLRRLPGAGSRPSQDASPGAWVPHAAHPDLLLGALRVPRGPRRRAL
jgi:hypothetical protein